MFSVHRDLKPNNLCVDFHGNVKIVDFGICREAPAADVGTEKLTDNLGTREYLPPDGKSLTMDEYAVGVILCEIIGCGFTPFEGNKSLPGKFWPEHRKNYMKDALRKKLGFTRWSGFAIGESLESIGNDFLDVAMGLMEPDNSKRMGWEQALRQLTDLNERLRAADGAENVEDLHRQFGLMAISDAGSFDD